MTIVYIHAMHSDVSVFISRFSPSNIYRSYKELHPLVPTILNELYRMFTMTNDEPFRLIVIELCLTLPTRLSVLLPHLPLLLKIVVPALQSNEGELVNLG